MIVLNPILTLLHFKDLAPVQLLLHVVKGIRSPCQPHAQHPESPEHMILTLGDATGALASYAPGIQVLCMWLTGHPDSLDYMVANVGHAAESVLSNKGRNLSLAIFILFPLNLCCALLVCEIAQFSTPISLHVVLWQFGSVFAGCLLMPAVFLDVPYGCIPCIVWPCQPASLLTEHVAHVLFP